MNRTANLPCHDGMLSLFDAAMTDADQSRALRDAGIEQAADHANAVHTKWTDKAFEFLRKYLGYTAGEFQTEDVRIAGLNVLPEPPSKRAWGAVMIAAVKAGLIKKTGYAPVNNPRAHRTPATVWIRTTTA